MAETHSDLVAAQATTTRRTQASTSRASSLAAYLRDARARADEIIRKHSRYDSRAGSKCQPCSATYPCDAVRAAEDVIAITEELYLGRLLSSKALLEFMTDLVDLGARGTARESQS